MQYRVFGRTGWKVSAIGAGTWALGSNWGTQDDQQSIAELNCRAADLPKISQELEGELRKHYWRRSFWYAGK